MERKYNLHRDKDDDRDFMKRYHAHPKLKLPKEVDLRPLMPPTFDQLSLGACTANAGVAYRKFLLRKKQSSYELVPELSRLDLYYREREANNEISEDSGASIRDIGKILKNVGICEEVYFPYIIENFANSPSEEAVENEPKYKINAYQRLDVDDIITYLAIHQQPILCGMEVYPDFEEEETAHTGLMNMPHDGDQAIGLHAIVIVGYKYIGKIKKKLYLICRNSWGEWGENGDGTFYMPIEFAMQGHAFDFWVMS
jgi:C1A family cysteine protease